MEGVIALPRIQKGGVMATVMDLASLLMLDARHGIPVAHALTAERAPPAIEQSLANPYLFITTEGACWLKNASQHGLFAELIAGRLAAKVGAGPDAHVVDVPAAAVANKPEAARFVGLCLGTEDLPSTENSKYFPQRGVVVPNDKIDADQRALVVAFQTWVHTGDFQVMVDFTNGHIFSHDHGDCFPPSGLPPGMPLMVTPINGVDGSRGCSRLCIERAVARVESCDDDVLLRAVACVPATWGTDDAHRLAIAEWLADRRDRLRSVMASWS
jgi:hypothetical protein